MKIFRRIIKYSRPNIGLFATYGILTMFAVIAGMASFSSIVPVTNILFRNADYDPKALNPVMPDMASSEDFSGDMMEYLRDSILSSAPTKEGVLFNICAFLIMAIFLSNLFMYLSNAILGILRARVVKNIRIHLFEKLTEKEIGFYNTNKKGDVMSRMTMDVQEIEHSVVSSLTVFVRDPLKIIFMFILLFAISAKLTLFTLAIIPLTSLMIAYLSRLLRKKAKQGQETLGKILGSVDETVVGIRVIKAFNAVDFIKNRFKSINETYERILKSITFKRNAASPLSQFLGVSVFTVVLYFGGTLVFEEKIDPGIFLFFIVTFAQTIEPIKGIANAISQIQRGIVAGKRVFEIIDHEPKIKNAPHAKVLGDFSSDIELKNLTFAYEEENVLKGINLKIPKGKTIALVGPSGAGKSTLVDMIPRFHDPDEGAILLDGKDLKDLTVESVRQQMGIVTQESILFNDTIFNNIAFGLDASKEDVIKAAEVANAHEFIMQTENGYDTNIGERGLKLSGGQRQRITIARAVLKNPPILLLDEATSSLDSESEKLVQEALGHLMKNRTSIVIAHRLSTILHADEIIVLKDGSIVERGKHEELLDKKGLYFKLSEMQSTH